MFLVLIAHSDPAHLAASTSSAAASPSLVIFVLLHRARVRECRTPRAVVVIADVRCLALFVIGVLAAAGSGCADLHSTDCARRSPASGLIAETLMFSG